MAERRRVLRMPGRVYGELVRIAAALTEEPSLPPDQEALCEALARARLRRRGAGHSVAVPLDPEQARLLMAWVGAGSPKFLREYRDAVLAVLAALAERSGEGT